ncbi:MAG TPA: carboxylesterase family protein [Terriglobales bacterium]|nr:carboxylesterase family protein [Terriglobales bacterium]
MSESTKRTTLTRREALILSATAGASLAAAKTAFASDSVKTAAHQGPGNCSTPRSAIAKTQYGKVRGYLDGGVLTFKGVPYGQTTAGENRWLPAKPPTPWTDEYPALAYGGNCPQTLHPWTSVEQTFLQDWDDGWQSEDMLKLNISTPQPDRKTPGDVLHARWRIQLRFVLRTAVARGRADGAAPRCCTSLGQSPAQHSWLLRRLRNRRLGL